MLYCDYNQVVMYNVFECVYFSWGRKGNQEKEIKKGRVISSLLAASHFSKGHLDARA